MLFQKTIEWLKQIVKAVASKNKSFDTSISSSMESAITRWTKLYNNRADWLTDKVKSLSLPAAIASEFARLVTLEMKTEITGSKRADYLNEQYQRVIEGIRPNVEYACAKGGIIFKPYVAGNNIMIDYNQADTFLPTAFDGTGKMTGCIFYTQIVRDGDIYTRVEEHSLVGNTYTVTNKAFVSKVKGSLGKEISLILVEEWKHIQPKTTLSPIEKPLFAYFKIPLANTVDSASPLGVSVYSRAEKLIKDADEQYSRLLWEFEGSELAIDAAIEYLEPTKKDLKLPKNSDRLFRRLDIDTPANGNAFYQIFSPQIRDQSLVNGLNRIFQRIEFNCNLAYGTISDPQVVDKTAEEIKASKQRSYAAVLDIQKALENALEDLIYAMDVMCSIYSLAPKGEYETSYSWDDSLVTDRKAEFAEKFQLVQGEILGADEFRAWYTGEEIKTARQNLPQSRVEE